MTRWAGALLLATAAMLGCSDDARSPSGVAVTGNPDKPVVEVPDGAPPSTLQVDDIRVGDGAAAEPGKVVRVHYVGVLFRTGKQFDASWDRLQPFPFTLGRGDVIEGWDEGVVGMKVGGRRRLVIPPAQAYGSRGQGVIGPNETLVFVIDLLAVV